ncbi:winged helix-turn-helix transcriptional regulator [Variovorax paradoxus]|nr:winged helix-turn-helix transcriptional regulator [Variovorax paradoxus]
MKANRGSLAVGADVILEMANTCVLMRTRLVSRVVTGIYDQELRPFGINSPQFALLVVIHTIGPATRAEIGRFHQQERSTLTRNLQIMLSEGWIEEVHSTAGGRGRPICLSKSGIELLHRLAPAWRAGQAQAKAVLGEAGATAISNIANDLVSFQAAA